MKITREQQQDMGLVPFTTKNFVQADRQPDVVKIPDYSTSQTIDVLPVSTMHVETKTSHVDRSKGFLISTVPLFVGFATTICLAAYIGLEIPIFSTTMLLIFFCVFVGAWLMAYSWSLIYSNEGIALIESKGRLRILEREQINRWSHYDRMIGKND